MKCTRPLLIFIITILICNLFGCGSYARLQEQSIYTQNINDFFSALDKGDAAEIKSLFSQTVVQNDTDLDEQIEKLISIYPRATTSVMLNGLLGGEYKDEGGYFKSTAFTTFPVISNNEYYWVYIELIYEDDFNADNIGLNRVFFYTADEYSNYYHDENADEPTDIGLLVYAEQELQKEVRCINMFPYEFTPTEENLKLSEVEDFLKVSTDFAEFTSKFGQPNATNSHLAYYYEIQEADGNTVYLEVGVDNGKIIYSNLVGEFEYIKCILEEQIS